MLEGVQIYIIDTNLRGPRLLQLTLNERKIHSAFKQDFRTFLASN